MKSTQKAKQLLRKEKKDGKCFVKKGSRKNPRKEEQ